MSAGGRRLLNPVLITGVATCLSNLAKGLHAASNSSFVVTCVRKCFLRFPFNLKHCCLSELHLHTVTDRHLFNRNDESYLRIFKSHNPPAYRLQSNVLQCDLYHQPTTVSLAISRFSTVFLRHIVHRIALCTRERLETEASAHLVFYYCIVMTWTERQKTVESNMPALLWKLRSTWNRNKKCLTNLQVLPQ